MSRRIQTTVLVCSELLKPEVSNYSALALKEVTMREKKKFDKRHKEQQLNPLVSGNSVCLDSGNAKERYSGEGSCT